MISPLATTTPGLTAGRHVFLELDRLEHEEQIFAVAIHLRSLVGVHRVFDGQLVQPERLGDGGHLLVGGLVEAHPDET